MVARRAWSGPLWVSAFRPFYLLGSLYAPLVLAGAAGALAGAVDLDAAGASAYLWHGHEMIFGFAMAIIVGTVLTALPSWAGTAEIRGAPLALLVGLWLIGRFAFWAAPWLPAMLQLLADAALLPVLIAMLTPQLARLPNRHYLLLLPILALMLVANLTYHAGVASGDATRAGAGLRLAIYAIALIFLLKGGVLTPIFTGNALHERGRGDQVPFIYGLEVAAVLSVVLLAILDLVAAPSFWVGLAAAFCAAVHAIRTMRWRGWRVIDQPLLLGMHLGFAWFVFAFVLKAVAEVSGWVPEPAWVHAFTVGGLGLMMIALMSRVSLRHTGRALVMPAAMQVAGAMLFIAAALRLAAAVHGLAPWVIVLSGLLWAAAFALYFMRFAPVLVAPSLPRTGEDE